MAESEVSDAALDAPPGPAQSDLDKCVHCGLCLNACPTYRELGVEMDSPRGRIQQMIRVAGGGTIDSSYIEHMELCLACRGCETACPSGVPYGRLIEAARAGIEASREYAWPIRELRNFVFHRLLPSPRMLEAVGAGLFLYQASGLQRLVRASGVLKLMGKIGRIEALAPAIEAPFFFSRIGKTYPAEGRERYRVAFLAGCIANLTFCRLNEATVRVLQKNGCEVTLPRGQGCCGALHVHSGLKKEAQALARRNIDAILDAGFDAIITNAAGCGSTLKEYGELLHDDEAYREKAERFSRLMKDVNEFLASIELTAAMRSLPYSVTYQDSCHLLHGQKIRTAPRKLLRSIPGLVFREMPNSDICCGSAGIYNVVQNDMAMRLLDRKMEAVQLTQAEVIATANPGCILQLRAGVERKGSGQRVMHIVELLDEAYSTQKKGV
ncbi:MAG: heterodisulfide reductase-related iron-sulfur binding cluster [Bryobacteraceae bacterium]